MGYKEIYETIGKQRGEITRAKGQVETEREKIATYGQELTSEEQRLKQERYKVKPGEQLIIAKKITDIEREKQRIQKGKKDLTEAEKEIKEAEEKLSKQEKDIKKYEKEGYKVTGSPTEGFKFTKRVVKRTTRKRVAPKEVDYSGIYKQIEDKEKARDALERMRNRFQKNADKFAEKYPDRTNFWQKIADRYTDSIGKINKQIRDLKRKTPEGAQKQITTYETLTKTVDRLSQFKSGAFNLLAERLSNLAEKIKPDPETYVVASGYTKTAFEQYGTITVPDYKEGTVYIKGKTFSTKTHTYDDLKQFLIDMGEDISRAHFVEENPYEDWKGTVKVPEVWTEVFKTPEEIEKFKKKYYEYAILGTLKDTGWLNWVNKEVKTYNEEEEAKAQAKADEEERKAQEEAEKREKFPQLYTISEDSPIYKHVTAEDKFKVGGAELTKLTTGAYTYEPTFQELAGAGAETSAPVTLTHTWEGAEKIRQPGESLIEVQEREMKKHPAVTSRAPLAFLTGGRMAFEPLHDEKTTYFVGRFDGEDIHLPKPSYYYFDKIMPDDTQFDEISSKMEADVSTAKEGLNLIETNIETIKGSTADRWKMDIDPDTPGMEEVTSSEALSYLEKQRKAFQGALKEMNSQLKSVKTLNSLGYGVRWATGEDADEGSWEFFEAPLEEVYNKTFEDPEGKLRDQGFWDGLFGAEAGAQYLMGGEHWEAKEDDLQLQALKHHYETKRVDKAGGSQAFRWLGEKLILSGTGQDVLLIVGTFGLGKLAKAGGVAIKGFTGGYKVVKWTSKLPKIVTTFGKYTGKALGLSAKIGKYTIRPVTTGIVLGGIAGLELAHLSKMYKEDPLLFPGRATRQIGLLTLSGIAFKAGYGKPLPSAKTKPTVITQEVKKPSIIAKITTKPSQFVRKTVGDFKGYMWAYHPKTAGQLAVASGKMGDVFRRAQFYLTQPVRTPAKLVTLRKGVSLAPIKIKTAITKTTTPFFQTKVAPTLRVVKGRVTDYLAFGKYQAKPFVTAGKAIKQLPTTIKKAPYKIWVKSKLTSYKLERVLGKTKGAVISPIKKTTGKIKLMGREAIWKGRELAGGISQKEMFKPIAGKLKLTFKRVAPERTLTTRGGIKFEELGITVPEETPFVTAGRRILTKARAGLYRAKLYPKIKIGKLKMTLQRRAWRKLAKRQGGLFDEFELEKPYKTYKTAESMHPLIPEERLWYPKDVEVVTDVKQIAQITQAEGVAGVKIKGLRKIATYQYQVPKGKIAPGKMVKVGERVEPYLSEVTGRPYTGKDIFPLRIKEGEKITEVIGFIDVQKGGFIRRTGVYGQIATKPSTLEGGYSFFDDLFKQYGDDVTLIDTSKAKIFDVRDATYSMGRWQKGYGISAIKKTKLPTVKIIESKGVLEPDVRAKLMGVNVEPHYQTYGILKQVSFGKDYTKTFGGDVTKGVLKLDIQSDVASISQAVAQEASKISGGTGVTDLAKGFYKPGGAEAVGVSEKVAEAGFTTVGGLKTSYYTAYSPVSLQRLLEMEEGIIAEPVKHAGVVKPIYLTERRVDVEPFKIQEGTLGLTTISKEKLGYDFKPILITGEKLDYDKMFSPVVITQLGETTIQEPGWENAWDFKVTPMEKVGLKVGTGVMQIQMQQQALKQAQALATAPLVIPGLMPVTPVTTTPTKITPPTPKPPIPKPPVIPKKPGESGWEEAKEGLKIKPRKIIGSQVDLLKPKVLASPFLAMESQIKFGKATHPKTTSGLLHKGIKTGFKIPTVELVGEALGKKKAKKPKFDWRLGENVKPTIKKS